MTRILFTLFGVAAYFIFFATFLYLIGFVGNIPNIPHTIDRGPMLEMGPAIATNLVLIAIFGLQHSIMARQGFKKAWTRIIPAPVERSFYVLFSSVALWLMFIFWAPMPDTIWNVTNPVGANILWAIFAVGWIIVFISTFLMNHFELFGLQQVYKNLTGGAEVEPRFRQPLFYKLARHPMYTGFLIAFWATPLMTMGHLIFSVGMTIYIVIAVYYEEKDLADVFGEQYLEYKTKVGMFAPKL